MPFYDYIAKDIKSACNYCSVKFEVWQSINDDSLSTCPKCGVPVKKLISQMGGMVFRYRQANQYNDIKISKRWKDSSGNSYLINQADGHLKSPTSPKKKPNEEKKDTMSKKNV